MRIAQVKALMKSKPNNSTKMNAPKIEIIIPKAGTKTFDDAKISVSKSSG